MSTEKLSVTLRTSSKTFDRESLDWSGSFEFNVLALLMAASLGDIESQMCKISRHSVSLLRDS
jgi:hypothetical protein